MIQNQSKFFLPVHKCKKYSKQFLRHVMWVTKLLMKDFSVRKSKQIMKTFHSILLILMEAYQVILNSQITMMPNLQNFKTNKAKK